MGWIWGIISAAWSKIGSIEAIFNFFKWFLKRGDQKEAQEKKEKQRKEYRNADENAEKTGDTSQLERMFDPSKRKRSSVRKSKARTKRAKSKPSSD